MRLAILIGQFPPGVVGGAELQAQEWARRLAARHEVTVITRQNPQSRAAHERREGFSVVRIRPSDLPVWRALHDVQRIDDAIGGMQKPDALLCFQTFISGFAGVRLQRRRRIPALVWVRGEDEIRTGWRDRSRWIGPRVWDASAAVLVQSDRIRCLLLERLREMAPHVVERVARKLYVVPNGIELPPLAGLAGRGVLAVGRLIRHKGLDLAIEATALHGWTLTIAGDGPERARLEALAARRGASVIFTGMVGRDRLHKLYGEAACVVLPARRGEGLPNVLLEAMAHGRPVVATPVMGVTDLVEDGVNGRLVPPDDAHELGDVIGALLSDERTRERMASAARATAERHAWTHAESRLEAVLDRIGSHVPE